MIISVFLGRRNMPKACAAHAAAAKGLAWDWIASKRQGQRERVMRCSLENLPHLVAEQGWATRSAETVWRRDCPVSHADAPGQTDTQALVAE